MDLWNCKQALSKKPDEDKSEGGGLEAPSASPMLQEENALSMAKAGISKVTEFLINC